MERALVILIAAVAALLPFERIGAFSAGGANVRASQIALLAAWTLYALALLAGRAKAEWRRPAYLALAGFFAAAGLSLIGSENFGRSCVVLGYTLFTASLAFLIPQVVRTDRAFALLKKTLFASAALVGLFGLWQFVADMLGAPLWMTGLRGTYSRAILGFTRVQSTAAEPLYFADYLLLPISLAAVTLFRGADAKAARRLSLLLGVLLLDVFLTSSRGGWLGLAVTGAVLLWLERHHLKGARPLLRAGAVALAAVAVGVLLLGRFFSPTRATVAETFFTHVTTVFDGAAYDDRARTVGEALDAWRAHPWIGVGYGGFGPFVSSFALTAPDAGWPIVNNEPLELLAETGVLGLAAFLLFLFLTFRAGLVPRRGEADAVRVACVAALAGMLAQYQTFSTLYIMHVWFTIGLLLAASETDRA